MPNIPVNGINLEYEEFGEQDATPLLLIMGLGAQMVRWHEAVCKQLASRGFRVIRYDNRDVGLSTKFHEQCPDPGQLLADVRQGKKVSLPYTLDDMADDAAGLLQALGIPAAHVVGASMGGALAQLFAIHHPRQMLTLTSIMSSTGARTCLSQNLRPWRSWRSPCPLSARRGSSRASKPRGPFTVRGLSSTKPAFAR